MIDSLSYQWSTVVMNDQQSFMAMINVYLTWSTVFHPMINVDHAWTVMNDIVHKAMNNANCIYTLTFTFLLSSSPTSGELRGGMVALSQMALLIMYEICWSSNDRLLIMDEICWSCNDAAVDRGWNLFIMLWYAFDHGDDMLIMLR